MTKHPKLVNGSHLATFWSQFDDRKVRDLTMRGMTHRDNLPFEKVHVHGRRDHRNKARRGLPSR